MQQSLLISSVGHFFLLFTIVFLGWELESKIDIVPMPVQVSVISSSEFDAKISEAPSSVQKKILNQPQISAKKMPAPKFAIAKASPIVLERSEKVELQVEDQNFVSDVETPPFRVERNEVVVLTEPKKIKKPLINSIDEKEGNEENSFNTPKIAKPKPRMADRIDRVAVSKSSSEKVVEFPKEAVKVSDDALEVKEISVAEAPKEASTKITPEGEKNVSIVITGAVQSSLPPPSRPIKTLGNPPVLRPNAADLLKNNKQNDQIEMLLAQVETSLEPVVPIVSMIEKNNMMSAIAQKLAKYWEQGILAGNSNFEKYVVQVEVEVNSLGEIIGGVKPLVPRNPKGRYLIAFRQASNALISAAILPIIPDKYPSGITFEITFDPETGFSF